MRRDRCLRVIGVMMLLRLPSASGTAGSARSPAPGSRSGSRSSAARRAIAFTVAPVVPLQAAAQRVGQQLLGQRARRRRRGRPGGSPSAPSGPLNDRPSGRVPEASIGELAVLLAPGADRVEVLEAEAERVHPRRGRTRRSGSARCASSCWRSERRGADRGLVEARHAGGRGGRRRVQQVLEDPLAAQHGRGARRSRTRRSARCAWVSTPPRGVPVQIDRAELRARDARDPVVPGQALVQEGVLRRRAGRGCCGPRGRCSRRTARSRGASTGAGCCRSRGSARGRG